jgi:hypothetical protein
MRLKLLSMLLGALMLLSSISLLSVPASAETGAEQFFGNWVESLSPLVQNITGTSDSADTFHSKLVHEGASFNAGIDYIRRQGVDDPINLNHLAYDSLAYMWPFIRSAYIDSGMPAWDVIVDVLHAMYASDRDDLYDNFITSMLVPSDLTNVNYALHELYEWLNKTPTTNTNSVIMIFVLLIFSLLVSINREYEFSPLMFTSSIAINISVGIWLNIFTMAYILIPILLIGLNIFYVYNGGGDDE